MALAEGPSWFSSTHMGRLTTTFESSYGGYSALFCLPGALHSCILTRTHMHIIKSEIRLLNIPKGILFFFNSFFFIASFRWRAGLCLDLLVFSCKRFSQVKDIYIP